MMKNQFLVDTIYNHEHLKKVLGLLKCINRNNSLEYIVELCEHTEIEEDKEIYKVFINELNHVCKCTDKETKENDDDNLYEELKYTNDYNCNSEEANDFEIESNISGNEKNKITRIYVDGIFDLSHSGHFNAMRQAKKLGDSIIVGINSDDDAFKSKGVMPIYTQEERGALIGGCKWVDEVIIGTKYNVDMESLRKYNCDYAAHGSDLAYDINGKCCYEEVRKNNRLKIFERSYGISSTAIINHLLQAVENSQTTYNKTNKIVSKEIKDKNFVKSYNAISTSNITNGTDCYYKNTNYSNKEKDILNNQNLDCLIKEEKDYTEEKNNEINSCENNLNVKHDLNRNNCYLTSSLLYKFIDNKGGKKRKNVVYVDGSFDIFHIGHLKILENAKKLGDFLMVGLHDDHVVTKMKGKYFPVVPLLERTLNVLAMRIVDDVVIGAPWVITENFIKRFHIDVVVRGTLVDYIYSNNEIDPYAVPKKLNIYHEISSQSNITTFEIIERIKKNKKYLMNNMSIRSKKEENIWEVSDSYVLTK